MVYQKSNKSKKFTRGNEVMVTTGRDKKTIGKILDITGDRATVEGVNMIIKHTKGKNGTKGTRDYLPGTIHISNLTHLTEDHKPSRARMEIRDGHKYLVLVKDPSKEIRRVS